MDLLDIGRGIFKINVIFRDALFQNRTIIPEGFPVGFALPAAAGQQVTASTQELASLMNSVEGDISELAASSHELDRKMDRFKV